MNEKNNIVKVAEELLEQNGSFSAQEVHAELIKRDLNSPLDKWLDIHKELTEFFGKPERK